MREQGLSGSNTSISKLAIVCSGKHAKNWKIVSRSILENIYAQHYEVITPETEIDVMRSISPEQFDVVGEGNYLGRRNLDWIKSKIPRKMAGRAGWYLQQFVKLEVARRGAYNDIVLLWDADTIPLKPLTFLSSDGKLLYYKDRNYHRPYFTLIKNLLDLDRIVDFSFIAQCFVVRSSWVGEFCEEVERGKRGYWIDVILRNIDFSQESGFSEYESLGTFITHFKREQIAFTNAQWQRRGNSTMGRLEHLSPLDLNEYGKIYDFASFETWDHVGIKKLIYSPLNSLKRAIYKL